jgi:membrane-associated protease RseP (regulator of RpoE activity)
LISLQVRLQRLLGAVFAVEGDHIAVREVQPGSPAAMAGLLPQDVVVAINDAPVHSVVEGIKLVRSGPIQQRITISRNGTPMQLTATTRGIVGGMGLRDMPGSGVLVIGVADADLATGLAPGDLIIDVPDWHSLRGDGLDAWPGAESIVLGVVRQGTSRKATFTTTVLGNDWYR